MAASVAPIAPMQAATLPDGTFHALPCRPSIACTADIVPTGMVELEVGYLFRKAPDGLQHQTPFLLKLTLADWVQAQVGEEARVGAPCGRKDVHLRQAAPSLPIKRPRTQPAGAREEPGPRSAGARHRPAHGRR